MKEFDSRGRSERIFLGLSIESLEKKRERAVKQKASAFDHYRIFQLN